MRALFALFVRALREDTRARLPPILRATLVLVILLILWVNERDFARRSAPGLEFLGMALFANLGLIAITTLGIFSSAITEEKEDQTLTLLRMTKLSPLAILFGKSTSRLVAALLLLAVQIPFTLLAVTLGGVSLDQVFGAYAILGATTFFLCNLALLCSVTCRTTMRAGWWTGGIGGFLYALLPVLCIVTALQRMRPGAFSPQSGWEHFSTWVVEANPVYALAMLLFQRSSATPLTAHIVPNLGAGLVCFIFSCLLFDRFCASEGEIVAAGRRTGWGVFGIRQSRSRPSTRRPLAWKDFHFLIGGWRGMLIRSGLCTLIFFTVYAFVRWADRTDPDESYFWKKIGEITLSLGLCAFAIELSLTASRIFGEEWRNLTLGSLATLPKRTAWLIRQKLLGCLPVLFPTVALFGIGFWLRFILPSNRAFDWHLFEMNDWIVALYIISQLVLLSVLVANLSLRIRRGATPAGISAVIALNVLTAVVLDFSTEMSQSEKLMLAGACSFVAAIFLARGVHRRIPRVAAAE